MKNMFPEAVANRPWFAFAVIVVVCFGSACNIMLEEYRDAIDSSETTQWQAELVLDAWVDGGRTFLLAVYAYMTRSGTKQDTP